MVDTVSQKVQVKNKQIVNPKYIYVRNQDQLKDMYEELKDVSPIAIDTEGTELDPYTNKLLLVQIGSRTSSYVIDALSIKDWALVKELFENPKTLKLLQNSKYDYKVLKQSLGIKINNVFDTMIAEALIRSGLPMGDNRTGLGFLTRRYTGEELDKSIRDTFTRFTDVLSDDNKGFIQGGEMTEAQLKYAAMDVIVLFPIFDAQYKLLQEKSLVKVANLEFTVMPVVGDMELRGFQINVPKWKDHIQTMRESHKKIAKDLQEAVRPYFKIHQVDLFGNYGDVINLNSQVQLMGLMNDKLNLNIPSTGVAILEITDHPIAKLLLEYRKYEKMISAFGDSLLSQLNPVTGRLHPNYQQARTTTGRFACSKPNLQQIPARGEGAVFRTFFEAPEGRMLATCDYSQQEMRVLADLSGDETLLESYRTGKDLHSLTAANMYGVPYTDDFKDKHKDLRQAAKTINFGLVYGRGASSLAPQIGVSVEEAKALVVKYFEKMPKIEKWLKEAAKFGVEHGYVETLLGRKRFYELPDPSDPNYNREISGIERASKNMPIQGTSADMTKIAMINIAKRYEAENLDAGIIHTLHDELVTEASEEHAERAMQIQKEEMINAGKTLLKQCPVEVDGEISKQWEH